MKKSLFIAASTLAMLLTCTSVAAADMQVYAITGVETSAFVNLRSGPSTAKSVITKIPSNGDGIVATGEEKKVAGQLWAKVYWQGKGGWISKRYLRKDTAAIVTKPKPTATNTKPAPAPAKQVVMKCTGTEPFWGIDITESKLNVNMADGPQYQVPVLFRQTSANNRKIAVIAGANGPNNTYVFLQKVEDANACSDGMSDTKYPYTATATLNNQKVVSGCCRVQQ